MDLERHENILIISHQATIRCMYAYFMGLSHEELPYARIPLHTIIELKPKAFSCEEKLYKGKLSLLLEQGIANLTLLQCAYS